MLSRKLRLHYGVLLAIFACRALVPVGFMPAPISAGGPIVICPGGAGGALLRHLAAHRDQSDSDHRHEHAPGGHDAWAYCPVGASLAAAALLTVVHFQLPAHSPVLEATEPAQVLPRFVIARYRARAPPPPV